MHTYIQLKCSIYCCYIFVEPHQYSISIHLVHLGPFDIFNTLDSFWSIRFTLVYLVHLVYSVNFNQFSSLWTISIMLWEERFVQISVLWTILVHKMFPNKDEIHAQPKIRLSIIEQTRKHSVQRDLKMSYLQALLTKDQGQYIKSHGFEPLTSSHF